jgi:integrase
VAPQIRVSDMAVKKYRKQIKIGSGSGAVRESASFATAREASEWYTRRKAELMGRKKGVVTTRHTLRDALRRYADEVAPTHKGERWEQVRLAAFESHAALPVSLPLAEVTPLHLTRWKDERLRVVGAGSVLREISLLGSVFAACVRDWYWLESSPLSAVRKPAQPRPINRVLSWREIRAMLRALGYRRGRRPQAMKELVAYAMLIALRTGMRAGEITGLQWARWHGSWVTLADTKNGSSRDVPLSPKARAIVERLRGLDDEAVLPITSASLDALFRKARAAAGLEGFTFHTTRHTAATWIGRTVGQLGRLSFPEFCVMFGWRDPKNAFIYVNPRAADLAGRV